MGPELEAQIRRSIEELNSLLDGEGAVSKLIAYGEAAIPALREFLLEGKPRGIYQPRRWAVEALAGLGAKDALVEYLRQSRCISDPVVRMGEEAVENAAAQQLAASRTEEVFQTLIEIARGRTLAGALEALGRFGRPEAVQYLISALEDDVCRSVAEDALRNLGAVAKPELISAALTPWPSKYEETPSSLSRRASAAQVLADIGVSAEEWPALRPLMQESDPAILAALGRVASSRGEPSEKAAVARVLVTALERADWFFRMEIEETLIALYTWAEAAIEDQIARCRKLPATEAVLDSVLPLLIRVKRRAAEQYRGTGHPSGF